MPGIFGIINSKNKIDSMDLINNMRDILRYDESYKDYLFISDHCVLGSITPAYFNAIIQPVYNEDKSLCLIMEGEIFNSDDLKRNLKDKVLKVEAKNDAELMMLLYEAYGVNLVHIVNGSFVLSIWDTQENSATFINDRLGMYYLYYTTTNNRLVFAPEMKALLCDPIVRRNLDFCSMADYFSFGFILGNKTFIEEIKLMPPGSIMRYREGKISIETYWDFPFQEVYPKRSLKDYIEELDFILDRAVTRQTRQKKRIGIALSGGFDSRIIAGYLGRKVDTISAFTFGDAGTDEVVYAGRVAEIIGSHHRAIEYSLEDFYDAFDKVVWLTEGLINTPEYYHLARAIRGEVDVAFSGHGGDDLSGRHLTKAVYTSKDRNAIKNLIFSQYSQRVGSNVSQKRLFSEGYYKLVKGVSRTNFEETFSGIQTDIPANIQLHHSLKYRSWREFTRIIDLPRLYVRYRHPFFDYEVIDFFLGLPPDMRLNCKVYRGLIINKFPELADIPLPNRRVSIRADRYFRSYYSIRNRAGRFLLGKWYRLFKRFAPPESEVSLNVEAYRGPLQDIVRSLILEGNSKRGYFNQNYLEKIINSHFCGEKNNSFIMHKLITFELFHRLFLDGDKLFTRTYQISMS